MTLRSLKSGWSKGANEGGGYMASSRLNIVTGKDHSRTPQLGSWGEREKE